MPCNVPKDAFLDLYMKKSALSTYLADFRQNNKKPLFAHILHHNFTNMEVKVTIFGPHLAMYVDQRLPKIESNPSNIK